MSKNPRVIVNISAEELNEFLGGDSEQGMKIKQSIVNKFSKKYLKGIVANDLTKIEEEVKKYVVESTTNLVARIGRGFYGQRVQLRKEVSDQIDNVIQERTLHAVETCIRDIVESKLEDILSTRMDVMVEDAVNSVLRNSKNKLIDRLNTVLDTRNIPKNEYPCET